GNTVREVLFSEASYAIYWSDKGIFVHFSDSPEERRDQRQRFTEIVPELCELRYLTAEMRGWHWLPSWWPWLPRLRHTLYDHNMAQALMLVMENKIPLAKQIAKSTLTMAIQRVTSDNTIRYVRASLVSAFAILIGLAVYLSLSFSADSE